MANLKKVGETPSRHQFFAEYYDEMFEADSPVTDEDIEELRERYVMFPFISNKVEVSDDGMHVTVHLVVDNCD